MLLLKDNHLSGMDNIESGIDCGEHVEPVECVVHETESSLEPNVGAHQVVDAADLTTPVADDGAVEGVDGGDTREGPQSLTMKREDPFAPETSEDKPDDLRTDSNANEICAWENHSDTTTPIDSSAIGADAQLPASHADERSSLPDDTPTPTNTPTDTMDEQQTFIVSPMRSLVVPASISLHEDETAYLRSSQVSGRHDGVKFATLQELDFLKQELDSRVDRLHILLHDEEESTAEKIDAVRQLLTSDINDCKESLTSKLSNVEDLASGQLVIAAAKWNNDVTETFSALSNRIEQVQCDAVAESRKHMEIRFEESKFLISEISKRVASWEEQLALALCENQRAMDLLKQQNDFLLEKVERALRMELLPPSAPLPEGPKMRLVIEVDTCVDASEASNMNRRKSFVLIPVSACATVGMVKREVLRRALQQGMIASEWHDTFVYSKTVVMLSSVTLFEEDTLEDVGVTSEDQLVVRLAVYPSRSHEKISSLHVDPSLDVRSAPQPPPPPPPTAAPVVAFREPEAVLAPTVEQIFLSKESYERLQDEESLERRLVTELARMERDPLLSEEKQKRMGVLKATADRVRITLLDRATYSHDDMQRRTARAALENLNEALVGPSASPESIEGAIRFAKAVVATLQSNSGESNRISLMEEAAAKERGRKERLIEEIKELIFTLKHRLRTPPELFVEAEGLLFKADRVLLLSASSTVKEIDEVHEQMREFVDKLRTK